MSDNEKRDERSDAARAADDAERERFEAWAGPHGYNLTKFDGQYAYQNTHDAREGWQAALSARADGGSDTRDAERVDWLEQEDEMGFYYNIDHISANINGGFNGFKTLREAIDAAIAGEKK
jgi:hypothetical protein